MITWTIRIILFCGITAGLFMGFGAVNDKFKFWVDFARKKDTA